MKDTTKSLVESLTTNKQGNFIIDDGDGIDYI